MAGRGQMPQGLLFDDSPRNERRRSVIGSNGAESSTQAWESHGGHLSKPRTSRSWTLGGKESERIIRTWPCFPP